MGCTLSSSMTAHRPRLGHDALPDDVVLCVASFLLGVDIVCYARASPALHAALSSADVWQSRLEPRLLRQQTKRNLQEATTLLQSCCVEKMIYLQQRALCFRGQRRPHRTHRSRFYWPNKTNMNKNMKTRGLDCGDFVALPHRLTTAMDAFSIELIFSIAPPSTTTGPTVPSDACDSGILLGLQTAHCVATSRNGIPCGSLALLSIDACRGLHLCAETTASPTCIATDLPVGEWLHLLLVFDGRELRAYLEGTLRYVHRLSGRHPWSPMVAQVGTGFGLEPSALEESSDSSKDDSLAWRPFHGLVATVRVWSDAIGTDDVRRLASGDVASHAPVFTCPSTGTYVLKQVRHVVTTRPCERYARVLAHDR